MKITEPMGTCICWLAFAVCARRRSWDGGAIVVPAKNRWNCATYLFNVTLVTVHSDISPTQSPTPKMSLLCAYSDSSASSSSEDEREEVNTVVRTQALPSVDDLFSSTSSTSSLSSSTRIAAQPDNAKRKAQSDLTSADAAKRVKNESERGPVPLPTTVKPKTTRPFAPPQLKRPNVSTEDLAAWNTQKTMQHQDRQHSAST